MRPARINRVVSEGTKPIRARNFPNDLEEVQLNFGDLQPLAMNQRSRPHLSPITIQHPMRPKKLSNSEDVNSPFKFEFKELPPGPKAPNFVVDLFKDFKKVKLIQKDKAYVDFTLFRLKNGLFYQGSLKFGRLEGQGSLFLKMIDPDISGDNPAKYELYRGKFSSDQVEGKGTVRFSDDVRYEGNFVAGRAHGSGHLFKGSKVLLSGIWINGLYNY